MCWRGTVHIPNVTSMLMSTADTLLIRVALFKLPVVRSSTGGQVAPLAMAAHAGGGTNGLHPKHGIPTKALKKKVRDVAA